MNYDILETVFSEGDHNLETDQATSQKIANSFTNMLILLILFATFVFWKQSVIELVNFFLFNRYSILFSAEAERILAEEKDLITLPGGPVTFDAVEKAKLSSK